MTRLYKAPAYVEAERQAFQKSTVAALRTLADRIEASDLQATIMELENETAELLDCDFVQANYTGAQALTVRFRPAEGDGENVRPIGSPVSTGTTTPAEGTPE